jgi:hypothetical protein
MTCVDDNLQLPVAVLSNLYLHCEYTAMGIAREASMKFLCLAYGDVDGWNTLNEDEKREVLAQDEVIRNRGDFMSAVQTEVTSVRNWHRNLEVTNDAYTGHQLPLAGFSVIEAGNLDEVIELVSNSPCARANGVIEIRQFWEPGNENA